MMYQCVRCKEELPEERFSVEKFGRRKKDCKSCRAQNAREWTRQNPEKSKAQSRRWVEKNPEKRRAISNRYYASHREEILSRKDWATEYRQSYFRKWRAANFEKNSAYKKEWAKRNPQKVQLAQTEARRRRLALRGKTFDISKRDWERLIRRYGGLCVYCRVRPATEPDHVVPLVRGGDHGIGNLLPSCRSCNASKNDSLLVAWRRSKGLVLC